MTMENPQINAANTRGDGRPVGKPFEKGNAGRPKGARSKMSAAFLEALCDDFEKHGADVIARVREEKPDQYLKVIASILPKEITGEDGGPIAITRIELVALTEAEGSEDEQQSPIGGNRHVVA